MSDNIYENEDFTTPSSSNDFSNTTTLYSSVAENISMTEVPQRSQQRTEHAKTQYNSRGHHRCYKLAVVLLCVLLLAVTIGLRITGLKTKDLQLRYKSLCEDHDQLQFQYNNITAEKVQLETERDELQIQYNNVTAENVQLETERDELQFQYNNFTAEKEQLETERDELQFQYNNITAEKVQLETKFNAERDELQRRLCELEPDDMKSIKKHSVKVILDPDTAYPKLIMSADGKQVKLGNRSQNLPDTPKRFRYHAIVLGREGFSSGKFYYEVQVKGQTGWDIGVAKESINRKGVIYLSPRYGLWTISEAPGGYEANDYPVVPLSLKGKLQRVGMFVDFDAGLVSFYNVVCWNHIYSFTNASFTEKIYPYFGPGENSAPLVISPVHVCPIN